ncbi:MAG: murein biosynthesis integral membrane protein MurJ [Planctomycetota bacterium]
MSSNDTASSASGDKEIANATDAARADWLPGKLVVLAGFGLPVFAGTLFAGSHWPRLELLEPGVQPWLTLDKFAHVVAYAMLAGLVQVSGFGAWVVGKVVGTTRGGGAPPRAWVGPVGTVLVCGAYGLLDEATQPWVGRAMTAADLAANGIGITLGLAAVGWARRWWRVEFGAPRAAVEPPQASGGVSEGGGFVGSAALVSGLTMVSRVTGLLRDAVLLAMFGTSQTMSAFFFGFMVPNLFRRLFGEGALTAAFLPRYRRLLDDDPALAARYARTCGWSAVGIVTALVIVGELGLLGVWWWVGGSEKASLALGLTALMLPYAPLICGVAFWSAVLQARGRFGPGAIAPVLLNVGMIVASGLAALLAETAEARAFSVAAGVLVCGAMQAGLIGAAVRSGPDVSPPASAGRPREDQSLSGVMRATLWAMGPMVVGLGVFQINTLLDGLIAYGLAAPEAVASGPASQPDSDGLSLFGRELDYPVGPGAMAELTAAQRLYQFPLGVFGIAIATAIFPALSAAGRAEQREDFSAIVRRGVRLTWFIGLPAAVGLVLVREPLVRVVFERGAFGRGDAAAVAWVLLGYGSAIWAYSLTHVLTRAFYARDDAVTPLFVALGMVAVNLTLNLTLIWPLGAAGLAWSTAISATAQCLVLVTLLSKHADEPLGRGVLAAGSKAAAAAVLMAAALLAVRSMNPGEILSWSGALALLAVMVPTGAAVYLAVAMGLRCGELRWLVTRGA